MRRRPRAGPIVSLPISSLGSVGSEGRSSGAGSLRERAASREARSAGSGRSLGYAPGPPACGSKRCSTSIASCSCSSTACRAPRGISCFGYGTWLGEGLLVLLLLVALPAALRSPPVSEERAADGDSRSGSRACTNAGVKDWIGRPRPLRDPAFAVTRRPEQRAHAPGRARGGRVRDRRSRAGARLAPAIKRIGPRLVKQSLPSGHAAVAFAAAGALIYGYRSRRRYLFLAPGGLRRPLAHRLRRALPARRRDGRAARLGPRLGLPAGLRAVPRARQPSRHRRRVSALPPGRAPKLMFVAGEASADVYGARILEQLRALDPAHAGLRHRRRAPAARRAARLRRGAPARDRRLHGGARPAAARDPPLPPTAAPAAAERPGRARVHRPPGFQPACSRRRRARAGIPVLFDISPQFWAWRPGRIDEDRRPHQQDDRGVPLRGPLLPARRRAGRLPWASAARGPHPALSARATPRCAISGSTRRAARWCSRRARAERDRRIWCPRSSAPRQRLARQHPGWQFAVPLAPRVDEATDPARGAARRHRDR